MALILIFTAASIHSNVKGATSHDHLQAIVEETSSDQNSDSTDDGGELYYIKIFD